MVVLTDGIHVLAAVDHPDARTRVCSAHSALVCMHAVARESGEQTVPGLEPDGVQTSITEYVSARGSATCESNMQNSQIERTIPQDRSFLHLNDGNQIQMLTYSTVRVSSGLNVQRSATHSGWITRRALRIRCDQLGATISWTTPLGEEQFSYQ